MSKNKTNRQDLMDRVVRVKSWQEFKRLAVNLKPKSVVYNIEPIDRSLIDWNFEVVDLIDRSRKRGDMFEVDHADSRSILHFS